MKTILLVDDDPHVRKFLRIALERAGYAVREASNGAVGLAAVEAERPACVLCDLVMPGMGGLEFLERVKALPGHVPVVIMTGEETTEATIRSMASGAADFLVKPIRPSEAADLVREITESVPEAPLEPVSGGGSGFELVGRSPAMREVFKLIGRVAASDGSVLILGETGTGKELVARSIHLAGPRRAGPFVAVNCAAIPETLLESELFGHERGAFTGADRRRAGKFEQASGGTLFLDEVGDMSSGVQAKILRVLQDQEFHRLGGVDTVRTDARIVSATNRDVAGEGFRADLFHRIGSVVIRIPPLRERREDIPLLLHRFIRESAAESGRWIQGISPEAEQAVTGYDWPGNVRELRNAVRQAVLESPGPVLQAVRFRVPGGEPAAATVESLYAAALGERARLAAREGRPDLLEELLSPYERTIMEAVLEEAGGNWSRAAKLLGMHRVTLRKRLRHLGPDEAADEEAAQ